jgi:hypothetical protein
MKATSVLGVFAWLHKGKPPVEKKEDTPVVSIESAMNEKETAGKAVLEGKKNITVLHSNGTLKAYVRGTEYNLRVMKPAHGVGVSELKRSLERNREMVDQSLEKMIEIYREFRLDENPLKFESEDDYRTATKNALVARANIDVLIPLINMRGGDAEYEGSGEGLPIEEHVEALRNIAEDVIDHELFVPEAIEVEPDNSFAWSSFFIMGSIVLLVVLFLKVFL